MDILKAFWSGLAHKSKRTLKAPLTPRASDPGGTQGIIKEPPMEIDGRCLSVDEFLAYVEELSFPEPLPNRIFLHHTWRPRREDWRGLESLLAFKAYYEKLRWRDENGFWHEGWTAGPHLFIADDGIWLFSDLRYDGVGVYGHNYRSRHIEMVGDYDHALPDGPLWENTVAALGILHEKLGLDIRQLNFHRDFSTKSCPGWAVRKEWVIPQVEEWIERYRARKEAEAPLREKLTRLVQELLVPANPDAALAKAAKERGLLGALTNEFPMEIDDQGYVVQIFAEALLVPTHDWDQVQSLKEFEEAREQGEAPTEDTPAPDKGVSPHDPIQFAGTIR